MIGKTISHYKILEILGEGGMGVVYKAEDTKLKRIVALKFLAGHEVGSGEEKTRFLQEAQAAAALSHPNICTVHEIDQFDGRPFIAMECVEGKSLKDKIDLEPLGVHEATEIAIGIAEGLQEAHRKGIVHRDIKPANIMLAPRGQVKIMDFGLAKSPGRTQLTKTGMPVGTVAYMSPEQAKGEGVDHRTDIWALGVVLYQMVTGELPFRGSYDQAVVYLILNEEPKPVTSLTANVPPELERVVRKALAKNPDERYQSIVDLGNDLSSLKEALTSGVSRRTGAAEKPKPSIAVLPFRDMSPQKDQDYFCEGISEELTNALVKLEGLRVAARTSAFQFKEHDTDIPKIGEQLKVGTVLEGSVRKAGNRLRITAQLIDVADGFHIWSEKYDRDAEDIFAIQDEISLAIVDKLRVRLLGGERKRLVKRHTENQEAYNLYLKGLYFWNRRLEGGLKLAMEHFHEAIGKDPGYALAYVGIADTYNIMGFFGYLPPKETFPRAKAAAKKALEIDETLGEAHTSLAWVNTFFEWDWPASEKAFKRAIELNPNYATAHEWYAIYLFSMGRFDEAIAEITRAQELDPLSLMINAIVGIVYYFARRYDESIAHFKKALEMDPNFLLTSTYIVLAYVEKGMYDDAIEVIRKVEALAAENAYTIGYFGCVFGRSGQKSEALGTLDTLDELARERYVSPVQRALVYLGLGETDRAFDCYEQAYAERNPLFVFLKTGPWFDPLRSDPRFKTLLKKIGLEK